LATSLDASPPTVRQAVPNIHSKPWVRFLLPSYSDCLFLAVLLWLASTGNGTWAGLLADGDTGWHIRTGEWILEHHAVPTQDLFSFTKAGQAWYAWEWLTDVLYAFLHGLAGLKGLVLLSALVIAAFGTILFRHMIARGATAFAALAVSLLVFGASSIHYLARPHIFTLLGLTVSLWIIDSDRRNPSARVWLLVPITLLWVNMHGGFLGLIACLGLLVVGSFLESAAAVFLDGAPWNPAPARRYGLLTALCVASSLLNPYGWRLHQHVAAYLRSDWIRNNIQEFLSPVFRSESALQFEVMLFAGLMTVAWLVSRRSFVPALWILFWAHQALASIRHVPVFMIVSAPFVAAALTRLWRIWVEPAGGKSFRGIFAGLARDMAPGCARTSLWIAAVTSAFILLPESAVRWPKDFPEAKFPVRMAALHQQRLISGRTLTEDQWADYLIYRGYPAQKVFVDGRSDFFGSEFGDPYLHMMQGRWDWEQLLDKYRIDTVFSPAGWPLTSLLKQSRAWRLVDDGGNALLFEKVPSYPVPSAQQNDSPRKKAQPLSNENPRPGRTY